VHEQDRDVGVVTMGWQEHGTVHVAMTAGLVHEQLPHVIGMLAHPGSALLDGQLRHGRIAAPDEPQRLSAAVQVEGLHDDARGVASPRLDGIPGQRSRPCRRRTDLAAVVILDP
jgi:hypothetical protein